MRKVKQRTLQPSSQSLLHRKLLVPCFFMVSGTFQKAFDLSSMDQEEAHTNVYTETKGSSCHTMQSENVCESH